MSFSKRPGSDAVCYTKPLDSLKNWNDRFFWVDAFACPASFPWNTSKGVPKDPFPKSFEFNAKHFATLVAIPALFYKYSEPFLCLVVISRYYTLDEDAYPEFLGDNDEGGCLLLLESTVGRVVLLLPIAPARASSELEASVDKIFDEGASGDGQGADIQPVGVTTDTIVEDVAPLQPRRQRKRKTVVADAGGPSHPPRKLREDYGALGGASTAGKSMSAVQSLFTGVVLNVEARGEPIPTLPFVTSSVSATPEREDKSHADSITGLNLRIIGASQRFVSSSDSSHHSGANIAEAEVDSIVRSSAPTIATVTTATAAIDADATAARAPVAPSLFGVGSSSTGRTDYVPGGFFDVSGSDFLIDEFAPPKFFASVREMDPDQLFTEFNVGAARQISSNAEVRMRAEYNIREKKKLRAVVDEQAELLKVKDGEIGSLKAQLLLKKAKAKEAIRLRVEVFKFKAAEQSLRDEVRKQEVADLDAQVTAVKLHTDNLVGQVHELEISSVGLQEKVAACEGFIGQLEKFQDEKLEEAAISKAVEKGMQEGLSAGITHGAKGRKLADVAAYNPFTDADYLSALQHLQNVNFSLIAELKSNKDASVDTIMNILRLDDVLAERLGLTESQPHVNQLMVPIHHSPDQRVVGASALSLSLEISHSRVKKMRENIAKHVSALRGVFVPLSVVALEGMKGTFGSTHDATTTLSMTFVSVSTILPISTDDYEVAHVEGQRGAGIDDETAAVDNMNLFSDVSNSELNILE
nr:hypothetical protein [Tanacetum cinerariifolium]